MDPNGSAIIPASSHPIIVEKELSYEIIGAFYEVYNELGFGLLEPLYARALEIALKSRGLLVERQYPVIVRFRGEQIGFQRLDMLVDRRVVVEIKSTERLSLAARRQLRCYVNTAGLDLGILLHFGPIAASYRELGGRGHMAQESSSAYSGNADFSSP